MPPGYDVHHGLSLVGTTGQRLVEAAEQLFAILTVMASHEQCRAGIVGNDGNIIVVG